MYDKTGIVEFARDLHHRGVQLVSSGGTAKAIADAGIPVTAVDDITGVPPILDHRVVTLHPKIHGGILADRSKPSHDDDMSTYGIEPFDLVVSNLYPFAQDPGIETIDVGGPAMVRAAAKNHAFVTIVTDASQYAPLLEEMDANDNTVGDDTRRAFAIDAFASTAAFDAQIVAWLQADASSSEGLLPHYIDLALERTGEALRYGENPHQHAARYRISGTTSWWDSVEQHAGLALSYLNLYDADAAWRLVHDLADEEQPGGRDHQARQPVRGRALKRPRHRVPAGARVRRALGVRRDRRAQPSGRHRHRRAHGRRPPGRPDHGAGLGAGHDRRPDHEAQEHPPARPRAPPEAQSLDFRQISGGFLVQDAHHFAATRDDWRVVTKRAPTDAEWRDAELAWRICGYVKSNAIVLVKDGQAVGIGAGQQNRVESGEIAAKKADGRAEGGACASDAFYPFPDGIEAAAAAGVAVIVQPGGAMRDEPNIERADELGVAMVFTGERHFLH